MKQLSSMLGNEAFIHTKQFGWQIVCWPLLQGCWDTKIKFRVLFAVLVCTLKEGYIYLGVGTK